MIPNSYAGIGKATTNLLDKSYHFGSVKVSVQEDSNKNPKRVYNHELKASNFVSSVREIVNDKPSGLKLTQQWTNNKPFHIDIDIKRQQTKALKITGTGSLFENDGPRNLNTSIEYQLDSYIPGFKMTCKQKWLSKNDDSITIGASLKNKYTSSVITIKRSQNSILQLDSVMGFDKFL
ncbi:hypothetical protein HDV02_000684 [Globomyces sp. JEL0801]|nr:hypothetical protein HDV02_000684 [Globomyces sp. JEL0801]